MWKNKKMSCEWLEMKEAYRKIGKVIKKLVQKVCQQWCNIYDFTLIEKFWKFRSLFPKTILYTCASPLLHLYTSRDAKINPQTRYLSHNLFLLHCFFFFCWIRLLCQILYAFKIFFMYTKNFPYTKLSKIFVYKC